MKDYEKDKDLQKILNAEKIDNIKNRIGCRPLSAFHLFIETHTSETPVSKGLILYFGHNNNYDIIRKIKFVNYWYCIDENYISYPDYIGNIYDKVSMSYFPENYFNCILIKHCLVDRLKFNDVINILARLIKKDGALLMTDMFGSMTEDIKYYKELTTEKSKTQIINILLIKLMDKETFTDIKEKINDFIDISIRKTIENKLLTLNVSYINDIDNQVYYHIILGNYESINKPVLSNIIFKKGEEFLKKTLAKSYLEYVKIKGNILIIRKISLNNNDK